MNHEDYLRLLGGDIDLALEVCENSDDWVDVDPVVLYHAAEILARAYRKLAADHLTVEDAAREHCETCQNSEWADECDRASR